MLGSFMHYVGKIFRKTDISYLRIRNVSISENSGTYSKNVFAFTLMA